MTDHSERRTRFSSLFESITGESTLTEEQQIEVPVRYAEGADERGIATYLETTATAQGFEDVIEAPETD